MASARVLLNLLEQRYSVDPAHIVFTGFSNGAHLVQLLGCRMSGRIDAIVPVSGALATSLQSNCHPARPLTVVAFHGTGDPVDPYTGGHIHLPGGGAILPVPTTLADWAKWNGCEPKTRVVRGRRKGAVRLDRIDWIGCRADVRVTLYRIDGGGHTWPGGQQYFPSFLIGRATHVINASDVIGAVATGQWH